MVDNKSLAFGSANCNLEIEQSILHYLVNDKAHPQASARFGTHFLAFPLLHVNRHLRQQVAKLLYKIAFETKRKSLYNLDYSREARDSLVFARSDSPDGPHERDDPRRVLDVKNRDYQRVNFLPTSLDHHSPQLIVNFKYKLDEEYEDFPHLWSVTVDGKGRVHDEIFTTLQVVSTAWFDETQRPPPANRNAGIGLSWDERQKLETKTFEARIMSRYGLKSAVPIPINSTGVSFDINLPPRLRPEWGTTANPCHYNEMVPIWEEHPSWKFRYMSTYLDMAAIVGDPEMFSPSRNPYREEIGIFEQTSTLEIELIQVPLLELLRPPISAKSRYYVDDFYDLE